MIERTILNYMADRMSVPVYMETPGNVPESYVLIQKTGGSMTNWIHNDIFAVQSYANTLYDAATLNESAVEAMLDIVNNCDISKAKLNSNYNFTDTRTKQYRYQAVFEIAY